MIGYKINQYQFLNDFLEIASNILSDFVKTSNQKAYASKDHVYQDTSDFFCSACKLTVDKLTEGSSLRKSFENMIISSASQICTNYLLPQEVCVGIASEQVPIIVQSLWEQYVNEDYFCPSNGYCQPVYEVIDIDELVQDILSDKPKKEPLIPSMNKTFKFIHWADIHTDQEYKVGTKAECDQVFACCREGSENASQDEMSAQYWGTKAYCDLPERTFIQMIKFVEKNLIDDIEFAVWTGDNTSHDAWDQTPEENIANTVQQTQAILEYLPDLQVYPIYGNHEVHPVNGYNYEEGGENGLKKLFSDLWQQWLDEESKEQLRKKGYYEQIIDEDKKLKIIALNTQSCDLFNFYLLRDPTDPDNMLQYLRNALLKAEEEEFGVYLIYHIPSNAGCYNTYATVFSAIVDRFSYTIRGQFSGHTHADELTIFYDRDGEAVNVNWIAPSFTSYGARNPSFRVIEADSETLQIVNIHQYRLDLDYWNQFTDGETQLEWENVYDMVSEYSLENIYDYKNIDLLRQRIGTDQDTFDKYMYNNLSGNYESDGEINYEMSCKMYSTNKLIAECDGEEYQETLQEVLAGPWKKKIEN